MASNQQLLAHAKNIHRKGDIAGARKIYLEVLEQDPINWEALCFMGVAAYQQHNLAEARKFLEKAYRLVPNSVMVRANLANVLFLLEDYVFAEKLITGLLETEQNNPTILGIYAHILSKDGRDKEALSYCDRSIAIDSNHVETLATRAKVKSNIGLIDGAVRDAKKVLSLNSGDKNLESTARSILEHFYALNLVSTFQISKRQKDALVQRESSIDRSRKLDIVTFFIPPQDSWGNAYSASRKTSWSFFLETFYERAKVASPEARVVLLTSKKTILPESLPNYHVVRVDVDPDALMYSRMVCQLAYLSSRPQNTASFFLDMDVVINHIPWRLVNSKIDIGLTVRKYMPPINGGVIFINAGENACKFFELALAVYDKLIRLAPSIPELVNRDFKKWWGDQIALCGAAGVLHSGMLHPTIYRLGEASIELLDCNEYNYSPKAINPALLEQDISSKYFLHFKGDVSKQEIELLESLKHRLSKQND